MCSTYLYQRQILKTLMLSVPSFANVAAIAVLVYFIYGIGELTARDYRTKLMNDVDCQCDVLRGELECSWHESVQRHEIRDVHLL